MDHSKADQIVEAFSKAVKASLPVDIEKMLALLTEPMRKRLFRRLVRAEIAIRAEQGETPSYEEYLVRFPEYVDELIDAANEEQSPPRQSADAAPSQVKIPSSPPWRQSPSAQRAADDKTKAAPPPEVNPRSPAVTHIEATVAHASNASGELKSNPLTNGDFLLNSTANLSVELENLQQRMPAFQFDEKLGSGGQGAVFRATRRGTGETVAIKVLSADAAEDSRYLAMFMREASVLSNLRHKRIVRFHEIGQTGNILYFVMEYVKQVELQKLMTQRATPKGQALLCAVVCQVLNALSYIHRRGIVHRDVKPSNILITHENGKNRTKLTDFGIAKQFRTAGFSGLTISNQFRGTFAYVSPEQLTESRAAGPSCDIYSTGATLFHYLAGEPAFRFKSVREAVELIRNASPPSLSERCPDIPPELAAVVQKAMATDPKDRFATPDAMYRALYPFAKPASRRPAED